MPPQNPFRNRKAVVSGLSCTQAEIATPFKCRSLDWIQCFDCHSQDFNSFPLNASQWETGRSDSKQKATPRKYTNWLEMLSMWNQWLPYILAPYQCVIWTSSMQQWRTVCETEGVKKMWAWGLKLCHLVFVRRKTLTSTAFTGTWCHWFLKFSMLKLMFVSSRNPWIAHCFHEMFTTVLVKIICCCHGNY